MSAMPRPTAFEALPSGDGDGRSFHPACFAVACNSRGRVTVAAGFDVVFVESGRLGDELVASAREVSLRGRSGVYDVTVRRAVDDVVVAEFRGRSRATGRVNPAVADQG